MSTASIPPEVRARALAGFIRDERRQAAKQFAIQVAASAIGTGLCLTFWLLSYVCFGY